MHALSLCVEEKTPPSLSLCNLVFQQSKTQNKRTSVSAHFPNHRAHPPETRRAHPPENRRLIVNPSARPDQVQGSGGTAAGLFLLCFSLFVSLPKICKGFKTEWQPNKKEKMISRSQVPQLLA